MQYVLIFYLTKACVVFFWLWVYLCRLCWLFSSRSHQIYDEVSLSVEMNYNFFYRWKTIVCNHNRITIAFDRQYLTSVSCNRIFSSSTFVLLRMSKSGYLLAGNSHSSLSSFFSYVCSCYFLYCSLVFFFRYFLCVVYNSLYLLVLSIYVPSNMFISSECFNLCIAYEFLQIKGMIPALSSFSILRLQIFRHMFVKNTWIDLID